MGRRPHLEQSSAGRPAECRRLPEHCKSQSYRQAQISSIVGQRHEIDRWTQDLAASLIGEILEQLHTPGNKGFVWVDRWNERYSRHFGTLRNFLESRPDKFTVIPSK